MTMLTIALASCALVLVIVVCGGALGWSLGLRGFWLLGTAAPFAFSVVAIASTLAPFLGVAWSLLPVLVTTTVLVAGISIVRRVITRSRGAGGTSSVGGVGWTLIAAGVAAIVIGARVLAVFDGPDAISQTFDNVFHLNAIRYILDEGSASALDVAGLTGAMGFYPSVWHATAALLVQITGVSIPGAIQALTLVVSALVWPLGSLALTAALLRPSRGVLLSTAVITASIPAFPLLLMDYGVLYPFQLSLALLPSVLALSLVVLRARPEGRGAVGWWVLAFVGSLPGLVLSHPGGFVAWLALSAPMVVVFFLRLWRQGRSGRRRTVVVLAFLAYAGAGLVLLRALRPAEEARHWPAVLSEPEAAWQVISVSMVTGVSSVAVAVAVLLGFVRLVRERTASMWIAGGMWGIGALLFFVVASIDQWTIRDSLTGSWYNNWPRLAAVFAVALVPLAVAGLAALAESVAVRNRFVMSARASAPVAIGVAVVAVLLAQFPAMPVAQAAAHKRYVMNEDSLLLSADEHALLGRLADEVPADAVIAGNPYTGTALAYAYSGRRVLMPHMLMYLTADGHAVNEALDEAADNPEVCTSIRALGITYVLDFPGREVHREVHDYAGLDELGSSDAVELVDQQGDARLYRVVACGLG